MFKKLAAGILAAILLVSYPAVSQTRSVVAHYMLTLGAYGNTVAGYKREIQQAQSAGIDGFALDMMGWGTDTAPWANYRQLAQTMFAAAAGSNFKLFFNLDCHGYGYDTACENAAGQMLQAYAGNSNYLQIQGRPAFSGWSENINSDPSSDDAKFWSAVRNSITATGINAFFIPVFSNHTVANPVSPQLSLTQTQAWYTSGWLNNAVQGLVPWTALLPSLVIENNDAFVGLAKQNNLFTAATVGSWFSPIRFFTLGNNRVESLEYNGGEGLSAIWLDIIHNLKPSMAYVVTWNDYSESYISPASQSDLAISNNSNWLITADYLYGHQAYTELNKYFAKWYKNGSPPAWRDSIYVFYRTAPMSVGASNLPNTSIMWNAQGLNPTLDDLYITTILTQPAVLWVSSGGRVFRFDVAAGLSHTRVPFSTGHQRFTLARNNVGLINITGADIVSNQQNYYNVNPTSYFGYYPR